MERDSFDAAIDEILASADGDVRRALRAILVENVLRGFGPRQAVGNQEVLGN